MIVAAFATILQDDKVLETMKTIKVLQTHQGMESYFASSMYNKDILAGMKGGTESFPNIAKKIFKNS